MKYLCTILICFSIMHPAYAELVDLYVRNTSKDAIEIVEANNTKTWINAGGYINSMLFEKHSEVKNYVNGKYVCSWYLNEGPNMELDGIGYDNFYGNEWTCITYFLQGPNAKRHKNT